MEENNEQPTTRSPNAPPPQKPETRDRDKDYPRSRDQDNEAGQKHKVSDNR